jgi:hypothetical protein
MEYFLRHGPLPPIGWIMDFAKCVLPAKEKNSATTLSEALATSQLSIIIVHFKVPSGQIGSAWEWCYWIGLEKDINRYCSLDYGSWDFVSKEFQTPAIQTKTEQHFGRFFHQGKVGQPKRRQYSLQSVIGKSRWLD